MYPSVFKLQDTYFSNSYLYNLYDMYKAGFSNIKYKSINYMQLLMTYSIRVFLMLFVVFIIYQMDIYIKNMVSFILYHIMV